MGYWLPFRCLKVIYYMPGELISTLLGDRDFFFWYITHLSLICFHLIKDTGHLIHMVYDARQIVQEGINETRFTNQAFLSVVMLEVRIILRIHLFLDPLQVGGMPPDNFSMDSLISFNWSRSCFIHSPPVRSKRVPLSYPRARARLAMGPRSSTPIPSDLLTRCRFGTDRLLPYQ